MALGIVERAEWGAITPNSVARVRTSDMVGVVAHHTVTASHGDLPGIVRQVDRIHKAGVFSHIAYNWLIGLNGVIYEGRGENVRQGASNNKNRTHYSICFIGDFRTDKLTPAAIDAFQRLRAHLISRGMGEELIVHSDIKATICPGDNVRSELGTLEQFPSTDPDELERQGLEVILSAAFETLKNSPKDGAADRDERIALVQVRNLVSDVLADASDD